MDELHPTVLAAISYLAAPEQGLQYFATKNCISKQALHKHVKKLREHLKLFNKKPDVSPELAEAQGEIKRQNGC